MRFFANQRIRPLTSKPITTVREFFRFFCKTKNAPPHDQALLLTDREFMRFFCKPKNTAPREQAHNNSPRVYAFFFAKQKNASPREQAHNNRPRVYAFFLRSKKMRALASKHKLAEQRKSRLTAFSLRLV